MTWTGYRVFVDDMRPCPDGWICCRTVSETIRFLAELSPVAEISLDHDILFPAQKADQYTPLMTETFRGVAYYIAAMPADRRPLRVRVHTSNAGAAMTMCDIMGLDFKETYRKYRAADYANALC